MESELDNVRDRAKQFEEDLAEESQGVDVQLVASQVSEYNQLKAKAGKKTTTLTEQLRLVGILHVYTNTCRLNFITMHYAFVRAMYHLC